MDHGLSGTPLRIGTQTGQPVWAPDGTAVAWGNDDGLFRGDPVGFDPVRLATGAVVGRPAWNPDGNLLAYVDRDTELLAVVDARTGDPRFTVPIGGKGSRSSPRSMPTLGGPAWSPDGLRLAFNCWDGTGDEVCVVQADGTGRRQITHIKPVVETPEGEPTANVAEANTGPPSWSPDGTSLAIAAYPERRGAASGVYIVNLENGTARKVASLLPNSEIHWFPQGEALLFSAPEKGRSDVVKVSTIREALEKLSAMLPNGAETPSLTRDGHRIAIASGGSILELDLRNGNLERKVIPAGLTAKSPAWNSASDALAYEAGLDPIAIFP